MNFEFIHIVSTKSTRSWNHGLDSSEKLTFVSVFRWVHAGGLLMVNGVCDCIDVTKLGMCLLIVEPVDIQCCMSTNSIAAFASEILRGVIVRTV